MEHREALKQPDFVVKNGVKYIFDFLRKKYLVATPEELVRQSFIRHLVNNKGYIASHMAQEYSIVQNEMKRRCDIVVFDNQMNPWIIVECKAPGIPLNLKVFEQIARYNIELKVPYLFVTNGKSEYAFFVNHNNSVQQLKEIPNYSIL